MRSRKEIIKNLGGSANYTVEVVNSDLIIELLLDIRELLKKDL